MTPTQEMKWAADQLEFIINRINAVKDLDFMKNEMAFSSDYLSRAASDIRDIERAISYAVETP